MPVAKKRLTFLCIYFAICKKGQSHEKSNIQIIFRRSDMFSFLSQMQYDKTKIAKYLHVNCTFLNVCGDDTVWQYLLWSFQERDTKLERLWAKNQKHEVK